ncbi:MAG: protein kinase domain-containing protein [Chitinophagaceae bacterium]
MEILKKYVYDPDVDLLGKGGFATVYKAYDKVLEIPVALKFFHSQDSSTKYTIINEIKRAILLSHPNIVKYYGIETLVNRNYHGQEEEVQIGIMEFVQEGQIKTYMSNNAITKDELKKLFIDLLEGLKYLHSEGIIHRDIKPQNILLGRDKQKRLVAKIADFGISKTVDSNQASASILLGTIEYMAPEQFNPEKYGINKKISYNVDVWAFGVTAYYLLTGELLFGSRSGDTSAAELINKIIHADGLDAKLSKVDEPFRAVLKKCVVPDAKERTSDIEELLAIFKGYAYTPVQSNNYVPPPASSTQNSSPQTFASAGGDETIAIPTQKPTKNTASKAQLIDDDSTMAINYQPEKIADEPSSISADISTNLNDELPQDAKSSSKKWLVIVALLIIVAGGAYWFLGKSTADNVPEQAEQPKTKDFIALNTIVEQMVAMKGGSFTMGTDDPDRPTDGPAFSQNVTPFAIGKFEVTQSLWNDIMNDARYKDSTQGNFPADNVSWNDATDFISKLNALLKQYSSKLNNQSIKIKAFRLPTSAEWEYACLADLGDKYVLDEVSWNINNADNHSHAVGTKKPGLQLYDMLGNVYEWCDNWYGENHNKPVKQIGKVLRGGDYQNNIFFVHPKTRNAEVVNKRNENIGFRLAATIN